MAALEWAIQKVRRAGGSRAGGFPGAGIILQEFEDGGTRRRVGLQVRERTPVRSGAILYADMNSATVIGIVTSGTFGPTVQSPIAMGYVDRTFATIGTELCAEVRGNRIPLRISELPFVQHRYKRN